MSKALRPLLAALCCVAVVSQASAQDAPTPPEASQVAPPAAPANPLPDTTLGTPPNAAPPVNAEAPPAPEPGPFMKALTGGKFDLNVRLRYEYADITNLDTSNAATLRTRLGYTTGGYEGFKAGIAVQQNHSFDYGAYNAAGLNGEPGKAVVADPEGGELDQLWLEYDLANLQQDKDAATPATVRVGRQRIILDDARFVGNVGWRNLEQTFDAAGLTVQPTDDLTLYYGYLWGVNRIFGSDSGRDYDSNSHLLNAQLKDLPIGTLTGFAYLLDLQDGGVPLGQSVSSQTYGLRLAGTKPLSDDLKLGYTASAAFQSDYGDNPASYDALYGMLEARAISSAGWFAGAGVEVLGTDDGNAAFQTPLATLHAFNGFADVFLVTPSAGLRDYYLVAGADVAGPVKGKLSAFYHYFTDDDSGDELGYELDAVFAHKFNSNLTGLVKYAYFDGAAGRPDVERLWLQLELEF